jgi:predicted RND superfamily exporter protein
MSASKDIIRDIQKELDSKINQREVILDQLQILDVLIDNYDGIIENIDREVLALTKPINDVANEVKAAYDARISAGCRSNLAWVEIGRSTGYYYFNGNRTEITIITYQVQDNPETASFKPYDGIKFYQKPSNRDYGSVVVAEFTGNVSQGSTIISVNIPEQSVINVLSNIQTGDTITDNLTSPQIFNLGSLP